MNFTFLTCTYNHSQYVVMHLESIKYQVKHFFSGDSVTLIIADDGSEDGTLELCNKWEKKNGHLFKRIIILGDGVNRGLCANLLLAMEYLEDERFYFLAGDDVYGYRNLKEALTELDQYNFISGVCPAFFEKGNGTYEIESDYNAYKTVITKGTCRRGLRRLFTIEGCLAEAAPAIYKSTMIDENVRTQIARSRMIEDQPMVYEFFRVNNINMKYLEKAYVMYRINPNSISHTKNTAIKDIARNDLVQLLNYYAQNETKLIYKYAIFIRRKVIQGKEWMTRLLPSYLYVVLRQNIFNKRIKEIFNKGIVEDRVKCVEHLGFLHSKALEYEKA